MSETPFTQVRPAAVAGQFYPADPSALSAFIEQALTEARAHLPESAAFPKALIVPHAGFIYSGPTAAYAYALLQATSIRRVVLLGPSHRVPFYGLALPEEDAFRTPLGDIAMDREAIEAIRSLSIVDTYGAGHAWEHSLEVQLPFLQTMLDDFSLLPLSVGSVEFKDVAHVIDILWGDRQTLFVISSDLSHYHPYEVARSLDRETIDQMLAMRPVISHERACGATGINALLMAARERRMQIRLLDYRNSGDTAGEKDHVVGYASLALYETTEQQ